MSNSIKTTLSKLIQSALFVSVLIVTKKIHTLAFSKLLGLWNFN